MSNDWTPVTHKNCHQTKGQFYHGTKAKLAVGDLITTGYVSNFEENRALKHVYFAAQLEPAIWGAELSVAYSDDNGPGYIYIVEPTGPLLRTDQPQVADMTH